MVKRLQRGLGGGIPSPVPGADPDPERPQLPWDPVDEGPLPSLPRRSLRIAGMELTQSIQHHGAAGESFGPDNSVPLVALKTLVVRVYAHLRPGLAWPDTLTGQRVTGELVLSIGHHVVYHTGPTRADGVRVGPVSELSRTLWDGELVLPRPVPGDRRRSQPPQLLTEFPSARPSLPARWMHVAVRIWRSGLPRCRAPGTPLQYSNTSSSSKCRRRASRWCE